MFGSNKSLKSERVGKGSSHILATWGFVGFIAAACAVLIGLQTSHILTQRSDVLAGSQKDTANLTASLIQHAELTFGTADAILIGVVRLSRNCSLSQTRQRLKGLVHSGSPTFIPIPQFRRYRQRRRDDRRLGRRETAGYFSDREHFIYHRTHDDAGLHIGVPIGAAR